MFTDPEFHRRRAEIEVQKALEARHPTTALAHLELARMHREKRDALITELRALPPEQPCPIDRTDKEG